MNARFTGGETSLSVVSQQLSRSAHTRTQSGSVGMLSNIMFFISIQKVLGSNPKRLSCNTISSLMCVSICLRASGLRYHLSCMKQSARPVGSVCHTTRPNNVRNSPPRPTSALGTIDCVAVPRNCMADEVQVLNCPSCVGVKEVL